MLDKFRAEWPVIRGAPWSVLSLIGVAFMAGFGLATLLSSREVNSLKAERDLFKSQIEAGREPASSAAGPAKAKPAARGKPSPVPEPPSSGDYVPRSVAEQFLALTRDYATPLQVNHLLQPYVGKRIRLAADLVNADMRDDQIVVQLDTGGVAAGSLFASFHPRWAEQLSVIPRGRQIQFDATIGEGTPPKLVDASLS